MTDLLVRWIRRYGPRVVGGCLIGIALSVVFLAWLAFFLWAR